MISADRRVAWMGRPETKNANTQDYNHLED